MLKIKKITQAKITKGTKVLVRINADVPLTKTGQILDDSRVQDAVKTLKYLLNKQAKIIILNKIGRPDGKKVKKLSNLVVAVRLQKLLKHKVIFCPDLIGPKAQQAVQNMCSGDILMTENTRFWPGEAENSLDFAKIVAGLGEVYINEAFSVCHRADASVASLSGLLPSYAGFSLLAELIELDKVLTKKIHPKIAIIGGAKIDTKVALIKNLNAEVDKVLLGGAIANAVLAVKGNDLGKSRPSDKELISAKKVLSDKLVIPTDLVAAKSINSSAVKVEAGTAVGDKYVLDIGEKTISLYENLIKSAKMIVWNGPVGLFEKENFKKGTMAIAKAMAKTKAYTVVGGGETLLSLKQSRGLKKMSFVSMAGGAMLSFLAGEDMPGLKNLYHK